MKTAYIGIIAHAIFLEASNDVMAENVMVMALAEGLVGSEKVGRGAGGGMY
jgi:hypothetical protein